MYYTVIKHDIHLRTRVFSNDRMDNNDPMHNKQLLDSFFFLSKGYQAQRSASADNHHLDLDYSGYHKNLIQ